ncbi:GtrA family protein [Rhizosphaericola mali]|uniref:GtrA family protein n=1 Tax=Rhizosphaericola mali TaxID=2545455 RepID=A0A5P2FX18_9BACT|nr:GtrA family protein [Rhizosphaericola mali]QES87457.1 GtrA family protein [Rhizosphaericola mali]
MLKKQEVIQFLKAQASSLIATIVDFSVTNLLINFFVIDKVIASISGTVSGGVTNFLVNRFFVFTKAEQSASKNEAVRYFIVWVGNLLLNAGGVYILAKLLNWNVNVSKIIVSLCIGFFYNYPLQKKFVFKEKRLIE